MENPESHLPPENIDELLGSITSLSQEMHERFDKHESRIKPIPAKLYHVTKKSNVEQILAEGLESSTLMFEDTDVVSLSDDIPFALSVAEKTQKANQSDLVVLEIDTAYLTPSRIDNYLREEDPAEAKALDAAAIHEVHYQSAIPPEAIKIIK